MRALIAMSGGVDSSVAAYLTAQQGYTCTGCTMKLFRGPEDASAPRSCCSLDDVEDARSVAFALGMPYYVFNFTGEFKAAVMDKFAAAYTKGLTPNPCIDCNRYLKFDKLHERARVLGYDKVVTGHYARITQDADGFHLLRALNPAKDQSYVLYMLTQKQLAHTLFPLGDYSKDEIRALAEQLGFVNARKPDSQDICFIPTGRYAAVVEELTGLSSRPGPYLDLAGNVIGTHKGIIRYTIGQHKGLGMSFPEPMYVCAIDPAENTVTLGPESALFSREALVRDVNWISGRAPEGSIRCEA